MKGYLNEFFQIRKNKLSQVHVDKHIDFQEKLASLNLNQLVQIDKMRRSPYKLDQVSVIENIIKEDQGFGEIESSRPKSVNQNSRKGLTKIKTAYLNLNNLIQGKQNEKNRNQIIKNLNNTYFLDNIETEQKILEMTKYIVQQQMAEKELEDQQHQESIDQGKIIKLFDKLSKINPVVQNIIAIQKFKQKYLSPNLNQKGIMLKEKEFIEGKLSSINRVELDSLQISRVPIDQNTIRQRLVSNLSRGEGSPYRQFVNTTRIYYNNFDRNVQRPYTSGHVNHSNLSFDEQTRPAKFNSSYNNTSKRNSCMGDFSNTQITAIQSKKNHNNIFIQRQYSPIRQSQQFIKYSDLPIPFIQKYSKVGGLQDQQKSTIIQTDRDNVNSLNTKDQQQQDDRLTYCVEQGNNSDLVRVVINSRNQWKEVSCNQPTDFRWQPWSNWRVFSQFEQQYIKPEASRPSTSNKQDRLNAHYNSITSIKSAQEVQLFNHFQFHHQLSDKSNLFQNIVTYCDRMKINPFNFLPISFIINVESPFFEKDLKEFVVFQIFLDNLKQENVKFEKNRLQKHTITSIIQAMKTFVQVFEISKRFQREAAGIKDYSNDFRNDISRFPIIQKQFFTGKNIWVIKPVDFNRGRGVNLFQNLEQLNELILESLFKGPNNQVYEKQLQKEHDKSKQFNDDVNHSQLRYNQIRSNNQKLNQIERSTLLSSQNQLEPHKRPYSMHQMRKQTNDQANYSCFGTIGEPNKSSQLDTLNQMKQQKFLISQFIIQKYMESPLLLGGRKFDIRIWVLVSSVENEFDCFMFKEGYVRTASINYDIDNNELKNKFIHLTNNAIQRFGQNYGLFQEGNQLSFQFLQESLFTTKHNQSFQVLMSRIQQIIAISLSSVRYSINKRRKKNCFEIFGYDFMLDSEYNPWLIEVNTNPCLEESSSILKTLIPRMIDDAFKLTLDFVFPDKIENKQPQNFPVQGYEDDENLWQAS